MNKQKVQTMINVEIVNKMSNHSAANVLKNILFNPDNHIDWDDAYKMTMIFMPELKQYDGYKPEEME